MGKKTRLYSWHYFLLLMEINDVYMGYAEVIFKLPIIINIARCVVWPYSTLSALMDRNSISFWFSDYRRFHGVSLSFSSPTFYDHYLRYIFCGKPLK